MKNALLVALVAIESLAVVYIVSFVWLSSVWAVTPGADGAIAWGRIALMRFLRGGLYGAVLGAVLFFLNGWCVGLLRPELARLARSAGAWVGIVIALAAAFGAAQLYLTKPSSADPRVSGTR